jgi:hypothetical protein
MSSFAFYYQPSGTITAASTGTYGIKDTTATVTNDSDTYPSGHPPTVTAFNDTFGPRWLVFFDDLVTGDYSVQLHDSDGGSTQPPPFSFSVSLTRSVLTITHPANNATVRSMNVVVWGDSTDPITTATLTMNGVDHPGAVLRNPSTNRPYIVQFPSMALVEAASGTITIKNGNGDVVTINVTVNP